MSEEKRPASRPEEDIGRKYRKLALPAVVAAVMAKTKKLNRPARARSPADPAKPRTAANDR
jgi:hypothetical protein